MGHFSIFITLFVYCLRFITYIYVYSMSNTLCVDITKIFTVIQTHKHASEHEYAEARGGGGRGGARRGARGAAGGGGGRSAYRTIGNKTRQKTSSQVRRSPDTIDSGARARGRARRGRASGTGACALASRCARVSAAVRACPPPRADVPPCPRGAASPRRRPAWAAWWTAARPTTAASSASCGSARCCTRATTCPWRATTRRSSACGRTWPPPWPGAVSTGERATWPPCVTRCCSILSFNATF